MDRHLADYPISFFDFQDGVNIPESEVRGWIKEGIERVEKKLLTGVNEAFSTISSGNTKVLVEGYKENKEEDSEDTYTFKVSVSTRYMNTTQVGRKIKKS